MSVKLTFHGAAGTVTGSCFGVSHPGGHFVVDCGLFQGNKTIRELNYKDFPFKPDDVDFVLLTHAHIDHSGLIPKLTKSGFRGPIYATGPTRDLLEFMLPDSGYIQESDVKRLNERNRRRGRKTVEPIFTRRDAEEAMDRFETVSYDTWIAPAPGIRARYWNAGHILGSASIEVEVENGDGAGRPLRLLFSGDIGPQEKHFHDEPEAPADFDYVVVESTYGDRDREDLTTELRREHLRREIVEALGKGGNLLIPAFAVERTQELLYDIGLLMEDGEIPKARVFLDSPLAIKATGVFEKHAGELADVERRHGHKLFRRPNFRFLMDAAQSKSISDVVSGAIIIAASGMCEAGRIRHHLGNNLWNPKSTVLFVGYQAPGTLGHLLVNGEKEVRIHGEKVAVKARIRALEDYSAHADQRELVDWAVARLPVRQGIFLTHGEDNALATFRDHLIEAGYERDRVFVPKLDEVFDLVPAGMPAHAVEAPRVAEAAIKGRDWHNEYAAFLLALDRELQTMRDDAARERALARLRKVLAGEAA